MVGVSASVNLPLHHKVQKFSSGTSSPGWSRKKGCEMAVVWILVTGRNVFFMLKTVGVHSKWRNIERHWKCMLTASDCFLNILTAFQQHSTHSNPIR